jgi:thiamine-phosphate pyrophosphorylase
MTADFPSLYPILDVPSVRSSLAELAKELFAAGVQLAQVRHKAASGSELLACTRLVLEAASLFGARVIVNDRADVAALAGAGGVHLGQEDIDCRAARHLCGPQSWVGISTHSLDELRAADRTDADYVAFGPIFETKTKEKPQPVVGLELLRAARAITQKPLIAIGGITLELAAEVYRAGADSVAVAQDLLACEDPASRAARYLRLAEKFRGS